MNERIHQYLDGEIEAATLKPCEMREAEELLGTINLATTRIKETPIPDMTLAVMHSLGSLHPIHANSLAASLKATFAWLWNPKPLSFSLRPAYILASITTLIVVPPFLMQEDISTQSLHPTDSTPTVYVEFKVEAQGAKQVSIAGTFTDWKPQYELNETSPGIWSTYLPVATGIHDYIFLVDEKQWMVDKFTKQVDDEFGGVNNQLVIGPVPKQRL